MKRIIFIIVTLAMIAGGHQDEARAFWGSDTRQNPSGLDVTAGYDVNTVTTIRGTVISPPARIDQSEHTQMTVTTQQGVVTVLLGPWDYWQQQNFTVSRGQDVSITGSRAQGKDGSLYLFAQKLDNKTSGTSITLRAETGSPFWSRSGGGVGNGSGVGQRSGSGAGAGYSYRGGGGMRGGGRR